VDESARAQVKEETPYAQYSVVRGFSFEESQQMGPILESTTLLKHPLSQWYQLSLFPALYFPKLTLFENLQGFPSYSISHPPPFSSDISIPPPLRTSSPPLSTLPPFLPLRTPRYSLPLTLLLHHPTQFNPNLDYPLHFSLNTSPTQSPFERSERVIES